MGLIPPQSNIHASLWWWNRIA